MRSNYKKLGPYIRQVVVKNKSLEVDKLLGVSITKEFIPSIANTVGTDMSKYKIVRTNQFAYGPVTSRNGDKISVALLKDEDCIISTSYTVFEIIDTNKLLPEYLMMWFRRPEFDRYARHMSHGSVRELFGWEEMCDVELPVPSPEKQRKIVKEYHTIVNRIKLNEQLNRKLEETAQAIYKQWFVDFEFPISAKYAAAIGKPELEGKPYKSSGGEMEYNDELDQEIPKGWEVKSISNFCAISSSKRIFQSEYTDTGIPFYRGKEIILKKEGEPVSAPLYISIERYHEIIEKNDKPEKGDILLTAVGTLGVSYLVLEEVFYFKDGNVIWFKGFVENGWNLYLYDYMQSDLFNKMIE